MNTTAEFESNEELVDALYDADCDAYIKANPCAGQAKA